MVIILFLFFFLLSKPVYGETSLQIITAPTNLVTGSTFPITFTIKDSDPNISYRYKIYGGIGDSNTQIQTNENLSFDASWDDFPIVTSDVGGSSFISTNGYIKPDSPAGSYNLYLKIVNKDDYDKSVLSSAYLITNVTTPPALPSLTPTQDLTITNPDSGVLITEVMPYSSIQWLEIYNDNDFPIKLVNWKIKNNSADLKKLPEIIIPSKKFFNYDFIKYLNDSGDTVSLINHEDKVINHRSYSNDDYNLSYSWSLVNNSWCRAPITKGLANSTSCYQKPSSTPSPIPTNISSTPTKDPEDSDLFSLHKDISPVPINEPLLESPYLPVNSADSSLLPQPTGDILGQIHQPQSKKNYLPLIIIIIIGGGLLTLPLFIKKFKKP